MVRSAEAQSSNQLPDATVTGPREELNPDKAGLWFAEAAIVALERPGDTINLLNRGLQLDPTNAAAYFDLGNARILQNRLSALSALSRPPHSRKASGRPSATRPSFSTRWDATKRSDAGAACSRENNLSMLALAAALHRQTRGSALAKEP